jgi:ABC-2 type transport system permease protein
MGAKMLNKEVAFALCAIKKNIQNSAELRTSFISNIIGMMLNNSFFVIIWIFFVEAVGTIHGWTWIDIVGMQGFGMFSFGVVFTFGAGLINLPNLVNSGGFDNMLLSPKNLLLRLSVSAIRISAIGDLVFGFICLIIFLSVTSANLTQLITFCLVLLVSLTVHTAVMLAVYSLSFFFNDPRAVTIGMFEVFITPTLFHGGAIQGTLRVILTFFIPALLIGALPVEAVRNPSLGTISLMVAVSLAWLLFAVKFFYYCVKRYESSNFMNFGS